MHLEILERPNRPIEACYGDQIVGTIRNDPGFGWRFHFYCHSWDGFNPRYAQRLKSMISDKIKVLEVTQRLKG